MKFVGIADSKQIFVLARSSKELIGFCSIFFGGGGRVGHLAPSVLCCKKLVVFLFFCNTHRQNKDQENGNQRNVSEIYFNRGYLKELAFKSFSPSQFISRFSLHIIHKI